MNATAPILNTSFVAEKIENYAVDHVSDSDLLDFVLGKGAGKVLEKFGSLGELKRLQLTELAAALPKGKAQKLAGFLELSRRTEQPRTRDVMLNRPEDVYRYMRPKIAHLSIEVFRVLLLDTQHRLVRDVEVAKGGLASCAISPRDVFDPVIREAAPAFVMVHNHPSGDPSPSRDDIELTRRLCEGARILGISIIDHVVIADGGFASLAEMGKM